MIRLVRGDVIEQLKRLPDQLVQTVVTSPPYWGLRDYGTATWEGGDEACNHRQQLGGEGSASAKQNTSAGTQTHQYRDACGKCGAHRIDAQIGLEPTPDAYVAALVAVFREVRRVLRDDGTVWLNLGDSYNSNPSGPTPGGFQGRAASISTQPKFIGSSGPKTAKAKIEDGYLKPKDLIGIPWRVAFALQTDGWWLRSDIIWAKPNPMPESILDRPTKAHEYVFLLAKSEQYFYDAEAIKEAAKPESSDRYKYKYGSPSQMTRSMNETVPKGDKSYLRKRAVTRNRRTVWRSDPSTDVWELPTRPFRGAHFAVFPPDLVKPCVLAGSAPDDIVLDPFTGSGTTLVVARDLGRQAIGIELNAEYIAIAKRRLAGERESPPLSTSRDKAGALTRGSTSGTLV